MTNKVNAKKKRGRPRIKGVQKVVATTETIVPIHIDTEKEQGIKGLMGKISSFFNKKKVVAVKEDVVTPKKRIKKVSGRRWWLAGIGLSIFVVACYCLTLYGQERNIFLGFATVLGWGGGGVIVYFGLKSRDTGIVIMPSGETGIQRANSLNIYPEEIKFENISEEKLLGQPVKCLNDNNYYHIHIWDKDLSVLKPFTLPDTQYRDPREFANNLNIPAHRKLAQRRASLIQKIAPFALVAADGIVAFLIIIRAG